MGSQEHFTALATSPARFRVSLTNLAFLVARFRPLEIQMPSSMYITTRRPLNLQYLTSGLSSLVKINGLEVSPKDNTVKQKYFVTPFSVDANPR